MTKRLPKKLADRIEHYQKLFEGSCSPDVMCGRVARAKEYLERCPHQPNGRTLRAIMQGTCMVFYRTDEPGILELGTGGEEVTYPK